MPNKLSIIIIAVLLNLFAMGQNNDRWNSGSSQRLTGRIVSLIGFISTPDNPWQQNDKNHIINQISDSEKWLMEQSISYNVDLSFDQKLLDDGNDIVFNEIEPGSGSGKERVDWIYQTMKKLGYKNSKQAYRKLKKLYGSNQLIVYLIANNKGRPYAMRFAKGMNKKKYLIEGLILYREYNNGAPIPITAVAAHETLHLFGAWDLYQTYAQTLDRQQKASELYPNDIMLRVDHTMSSLEIDKLTAWLIGWNEHEEEIFQWFRPSDFGK